MIELTTEHLMDEAKKFCEKYSLEGISELYGVSDGKAVGTYIEKLFKLFLNEKYNFERGNAARGVDLPSIDTDIKVTSIAQPQSSSPFKSARQKIYGLGYNLLLFVYDKRDDMDSMKATMNFVSCAFIEASRTSDFTLTKLIIKDIENGANQEDIIALFNDRNLPGDDIIYTNLANEVLANPPIQGYLTISNALQWRLQYRRIVDLKPNEVGGIEKIV